MSAAHRKKSQPMVRIRPFGVKRILPSFVGKQRRSPTAATSVQPPRQFSFCRSAS